MFDWIADVNGTTHEMVLRACLTLGHRALLGTKDTPRRTVESVMFRYARDATWDGRRWVNAADEPLTRDADWEWADHPFIVGKPNPLRCAECGGNTLAHRR